MVASPSHGSFGNAEENWFGSDDVEAQSRAALSVAAVGARIVGAKPFPIAARRLEELTRNPKARLEQVVSVLETDPGLSVRLLRLVNSAGYGLKVRVTSVRHAAVLVGTRRLHQVATTAAILDLFDASNETAVELLEHAAVVGSLCRYLAVHLGLPHDELFTCGFLHDIGKLMLLDTEGEKYGALVRTYGGAPDQLHIHERQMFGFDHAVLGAHVLTAWNIPEPVPKVVAFHHQPSRAMQDTLLASMVQTLRLADMMSYAVVMDSEEAGIALVTESEAAQYLEISEPQVAAMWSDLRALADRSRARSHGQPDLEVVAPRRLDVPRSLRPRRSVAPRSLRPGEVPSISMP
ncbi:MAG TPA: HDOD domain-containing protein, partial [Polyangiaceae bacterium]